MTQKIACTCSNTSFMAEDTFTHYVYAYYIACVDIARNVSNTSYFVLNIGESSVQISTLLKLVIVLPVYTRECKSSDFPSKKV